MNFITIANLIDHVALESSRAADSHLSLLDGHAYERARSVVAHMVLFEA